MTAHDILQQAAKHMQDRAATYDKPQGERSMGATVDAFEAVTGISMTEEQGWLFMALLKAVRSQQGAYRADSYEDGAAYFALAGEAAANARQPWTPELVDAFNSHPMTPNVWDEGEKRMDNIARSHGDGEHYAATEQLRQIDEALDAMHYDPRTMLDCGGASFEESADFEPVQHISDTDGAGVWTVWAGGKCPVKSGSLVEVERLNGRKGAGKADNFAWTHIGYDSDIIRYRLL